MPLPYKGFFPSPCETLNPAQPPPTVAWSWEPGATAARAIILGKPSLDKSAFTPDTRYTVAWKGPEGKVEPANLYVYRTYDKFMVARLSSGAGVVRRVAYDEILKVAKETRVEPEARLSLPAALLDEKFWRDREELESYASSARLGK